MMLLDPRPWWELTDDERQELIDQEAAIRDWNASLPPFDIEAA